MQSTGAARTQYEPDAEVEAVGEVLMAPPLLLLVLRCALAGPRRVAEPRAGRWRSLAPTGGALLGATLLLVLLIAASTIVAVTTAATFALTPLALAIATTTAIGGRRGGRLAGRGGT